MRRNFLSFLVLFILATCLLVPSSGESQDKAQREADTPADSYGNVCWEDEQKLLNRFADHLQQDAMVTGYITVYAGRLSCPGEARYRAERAKGWVVKRGVKADRIVWKDGGYREKVETILWPGQKGKVEIAPKPALLSKDVVVFRRCVGKTYEHVICTTPR